jgi:hypothetical protein
MRLFGGLLSHHNSGTREGRERPHAEPKSVEAVLRQLFDIVDRVELPRRRPQTVDVLTFRDVVAYFTEKHPADLLISYGALLSTPHPKGRLVFQVFLDEKDKVCSDPDGAPYGRRLIARRFDDELTSYFGGDDLLIFR